MDVLLWSANQPVSAATRKALLAYANRGGAIVAHHPGTWDAWKNFREWNLQVVGGGTRGHDALGAYTVKITNATHPITKALHASFEIADELYISLSTVKTHIASLMNKLGARNRVEIAMWAYETGRIAS